MDIEKVRKARDELEKLVIEINDELVDIERVKRFINPELRAKDKKNLLTEFIRTNGPNNVLFYCFHEYDLQKIAVDQLGIDKKRNLRGDALIRAILEWYGYPPVVVPEGLLSNSGTTSSNLGKS